MTSPLMLVRHAWAGDREAWPHDDALRPLDARGRAQAEALIGSLAPLRPVRLLTSPYLRCVQTLAPLSDALGLPLELSDALAEGSGGAVLSVVPGLAPGTVLCTHGDIVELLAGPGSPKKKGSVWLLDADPSAMGGWTPARYLAPRA